MKVDETDRRFTTGIEIRNSTSSWANGYHQLYSSVLSRYKPIVASQSKRKHEKAIDKKSGVKIVDWGENYVRLVSSSSLVCLSCHPPYVSLRLL